MPFCLQKKDVERTIGIDTDYIETNDFNLEYLDKQFLVEVSIFKHIARISLPSFNVGHENLRNIKLKVPSRILYFLSSIKFFFSLSILEVDPKAVCNSTM